MRTLYLLILSAFLFTGTYASAQTGDTGEDIVTFAEVMPVFPGNLNEWVVNHIRYPRLARVNNIEGKVFVQFIVDRSGRVDRKSIVIISNIIGYGLEDEAIRMVSNMPRWKPAYQSGKPVSCKMTLPIVFRLM